MPIFTKIKNLIATNYGENLPYITVGLISGLVCCLYAMLFSFLESTAVKFYHHNEYFIFFVSPLLMASSYILVNKIAPGAFGSGIPQVMVCIDKDHRHRSGYFLSIRIIIVKLLSSILAIFGGAAIGREGPSLQISASIGEIVARHSKRFKIPVKAEQLIIAGAASGLAAAFNTPIGGIIYAIEELAQDHIRSYKTVLILAVMIAGFTAQLFLGNYLYLGYPEVLNHLTVQVILAVTIVSFFSGIAGAIFADLLLFLSSQRKKFNFSGQLSIAIFVGLALAGLFYFAGERTIFSGKESINYVLFNPDPIGYWETILRFSTPILSSLTGIAGGIFAPSLSAGATLGGLAASIINHPELKVILGLAGMIGFLNGVTRTPITSFILVQEMTNRHSAVFPMMLAAIFSSLGASLMGHKSYYEKVAEELKAQDTSAHVTNE